MNTENQIKEKKDFTSYKEVLAELKKYVEDKIARKNQNNTQNSSMQDIPLANQPEMQSDHLTEEAALTVPQTDVTETIATEVNNQGLDTAAIPETVTYIDTSVSANNGPEMVQSSFESNPTPNPTPAPVQFQTENSSLPNNQGVETANAGMEIGEGVSLEQVPQTLANQEGVQGFTSDTLANADSVGLVSEGQSQPLGQMETAMEQPQGFTSTLDKQLPDSALSTDAQLTTNVNGLMNETASAQGQVQGLEDVSTVGIVQKEAQQEPIPTNEFLQANTLGDTNNFGMEAIPDIVMPEITNGEIPSTEVYQASSSGAQAQIAEATPALSDTKVIMPEGTTAEIANDQNLVVGPEAFNIQTR